ncbi:MAG: serine/threonine-protein kinase [Elusimicrobiota bacterium]
MKEWMINSRYLVMSEVGEGGFATVYKAWDNMLQKFVAIKKIHKEYSSDAKFVDMFKNEAVNTARLEHENIVRVINFIRDTHNNHYIIMDFVRGVDLEYLMNKCPELNIKITPDIAMYIIGEVLKALDYAHSVKDEVTGEPLNIVHRDISPGNVMLYFNGRIKLTDFGIAKAGDARLKRENKEKLTGKISYMSPEQANGDRQLDGRSDLFSCGIVLFEMLTGEKAFAGDTDVSVWKKVKKAKVDFKKLKEYQIPDEIQQILKKVLQRKAEDRYKNAAAMFIDIKKYLSKKGKTDYLKDEYEDFITDALKEERVEAKKRREKESEKNFKEIAEEASIRNRQKAQSKETPNPPPSTKDKEGEAGDSPGKGGKDKTVIDFVLDSAKRYKKIFITSLLSILLAGLIFTAVDTYYQLTDFGIKINNTIWPPALQIDSVPSEAKINITQDGESIIEEEEAVTPFALEEIRPGNYKLEMEKEGFGTLERNITVYEGVPGEQNISIPGSRFVEQVHIVPFEIKVAIKSVPSEADLFINGRNIGETPFDDMLELGMYSFKLQKEGFEVLGSDQASGSFEKGDCIVDLMNPDSNDTNIDRRFWQYNEKEDAGEKSIEFTGKLWKNFSVTSRPSGAQVYVDDASDPFGQTPMETLSLTAGTHTVKISRSGYQSWEDTVKVDENSDEEIKAVLKKQIKISAYESGNPSKVVNARVSIPGTGVDRTTPFSVVLPVRRHTFKFRAEPEYKAKTFTRDVANLRQRLNVGLELQPPHLEVRVKEYDSENEIPNATIWLEGEYWKRTSKLGIASGYVDREPGELLVEARSDEYGENRVQTDVERGDRKTVEIVLGAPQDATIVVDTSDITQDSKIYLDGEYKGEAFQQMSQVSRGTHNIVVDIEDYPEEIEKQLKIEEAEALIILNLVEEEGAYVLKEQDPEAY